MGVTHEWKVVTHGWKGVTRGQRGVTHGQRGVIHASTVESLTLTPPALADSAPFGWAAGVIMLMLVRCQGRVHGPQKGMDS